MSDQRDEIIHAMTAPQRIAFLRPCLKAEDCEAPMFYHDLKIRDKENGNKAYWMRAGLTLNLSPELNGWHPPFDNTGIWQCSASLRRKRSRERPLELDEWTDREHRLAQGVIEGVLGTLGAAPRSLDNAQARRGETGLHMFLRCSEYEMDIVRAMYPLAPIFLKRVVH